jgi:hypothetical protein
MDSEETDLKIKTILFGLGNIGMLYDLENLSSQRSDHFLTHAKSLTASTRFQLVAGVDLNEDNQKLFSRTYDLPAYSRLDELPDLFPIDLLVIAIPTTDQVKECLKLDGDLLPRNLLIEKPVGNSALESKELLAWGELNDISIFVNYFRNRFKSSISARSVIKQIDFRNVHSVKVVSYGEIRNIFSHFLELSEYLLPGRAICGCIKSEIRRNSGSYLFFWCATCSRRYEFDGINSEKRETVVEITGDFHQLRILNNGRTIEIKSLINDWVQTFTTPLEDFNRYQAIFYQSLFEEMCFKKTNQDLNRAILVQEFIDGIS